MLLAHVSPRTTPQIAQQIATITAVAMSKPPPDPAILESAMRQVMPTITAVMAHLEIKRPRSSLFLSQRYRIQPMIPAHKTNSRTPEIFGGSQFMSSLLSFCACMGTVNPSLTPPRRGTDGARMDTCSPPGRGRGWVGPWRASFHFCACTGTMNLNGRTPALSPHGGERVAEGRERGGSWRVRRDFLVAVPCDSASSLVRPFGDPVRVAGAAQRGVVADLAAAVEFVKAAIHQHHAIPGAGLDAILKLMQAVFADQIADGAVGDEQFVRKHAARTIHRREQFLGNDTLQRIGQLQHNLALDASIENANNPFQ